MNVRLLKKIIKAIDRKPKRLDMQIPIHINHEDAPCKTAACIAGHAVLIDEGGWVKPAKKLAENHPYCGIMVNWDYVQPRARKLLGLTFRQARRLFHKSYWPSRFWDPTSKPSARQKASLACSRILHFIKTKGAE